MTTSGLQSDLLVVGARARGSFFGASATKKWTIIDWKVNVSKPAPIRGEHQSPAHWPHTRMFPGKTKLVLQPRSSNRGSQPKPTTKNQTTSNRLTQSQPFHVHPKRQATDQPKHWALLSPCQKILSIGGPKIKGQKRNQLGRPSMVRPVLLQFLDTKKMKATNSAKNAIHLWMRQCKPTPKHLLRMVEREVHLECLGASVERPV